VKTVAAKNPVKLFLVALLASLAIVATPVPAQAAIDTISLTPLPSTFEVGSGSPEMTMTYVGLGLYSSQYVMLDLSTGSPSSPDNPWTPLSTCPVDEANATADLSLCGISSFSAVSTNGFPTPDPLPVKAFVRSLSGQVNLIFDPPLDAGSIFTVDRTFTLVLAKDAFTITAPFNTPFPVRTIQYGIEVLSQRNGNAGVDSRGADGQRSYYLWSFNANGGTGQMPDIQVPDDDALPPNLNGFSKPGFEFAGWAWSQEDADKGLYSFVPPQGGGTLYAVWRAAGSGPTPPAPPAWTAPVDVSSPLGNAEGAQVVVDSDGRATVVWDRNNGGNYIVQSSTSLDGGEWAAPDDLSATGANAVVPQVSVSVNADGTAVAVWSRSNGSNTIIQSSTSINGGEWSTPVDDLSEVGGDAFYPQVTVDATGTAIAVWRTRSNGTNDIVQASTRPSGGSWSTPVDLSAAGEDATNPQVTVGADGTAIAVWTRSNGTNDIVQASTRPSGGSWTTPADNLSEAGQDASAPQVSVDANGTATAVWIRDNGTNDIVQASTRPRGGPWSTPVANLSEAGEDAGSPQVAVDANGTAIAVWNRSDGSNTIVQASSRPSGGSWTTPADNLSEAGQDAWAPQVSVDANGAATVVWNRYDGSNFIIQSSRSADGVTWDTPVDLSDPLQDALAPQVTVGPSGLVTAVWERSNGTNTIIQSSSLVTAASPEAGSGGAALADTGLTSWSAVLVVVAAATLFILAYGTYFARSQLRLAGDNNKLHSLLRRAGLRD
jgi:hypothetical protein